MSDPDGKQSGASLRALAELEFSDLRDWLAVLEDKLRQSFPENSAIVSRFVKLRTDLDAPDVPAPGTGQPSPPRPEVIKAQARDLVKAAAVLLDSQPAPPEELKDHVDRLIQQGYFKSIYFRALAVGFTLVLALITGVGTFKLNEQVQAMKAMVAEANKQVVEGKAEVEMAKAETQKAKDANSRQQAELALLILQGNSDLAKLRINAMTEISKSEDAFKAEVADRTRRWQVESEAAVLAARQRVDSVATATTTDIQAKAALSIHEFDKTLNDSRTTLRNALTSRLARLEAAERPWVPQVIWSMAKAWLLAPLTLLIALAALLIASLRRLSFGHIAKVATAASVLLVVAAFVWSRI